MRKRKPSKQKPENPAGTKMIRKFVSKMYGGKVSADEARKVWAAIQRKGW